MTSDQQLLSNIVDRWMKHKTDKVRNKKHKIVLGCEPDKEKKERFLQIVHKENLIKQRMNVYTSTS